MPETLRTLDVVDTGGLAAIIAVVALNGSTPAIGWAGGLLLVGGFLVADLSIRVGLWHRHRGPDDGSSSEQEHHERPHSLEGRWIAFLRGPWTVAGPVATIIVDVVLVLTLGLGLATLIFSAWRQ